jgi:crotonobetainyl-CoA:carnitine CoA-transferase CaiB-like acyl-CoA transferase
MSWGLKGIKVVEAASAVAAPMVGRLLADWGAEVIHIDQPTRGGLMKKPSGHSDVRNIGADFNYVEQNLNCNKRCIALDIGKESGRQVLVKLLQQADVFIRNFRPQELTKFKLEYSDVSQINPRLICANLTGFGRNGPDKNEPGFGPTAGDSRAGLLHVLLAPGAEPAQMPVAYTDLITAMTLAYGIMTALLVRERTGVAQEVDASLFNSITWTMVSDIAGTLVTGKDRQAVKRIDRGTPFLNSYRTKDNRWLYLMINRREIFWSKFCAAIGDADLEKDSRYNSDTLSFENSKLLFNILREGFLTKTLEEWKPILTDVGPWAPVQNLQEVVKDPQARANGFFTSLEHPKHGKIEIMANPVKFSKMPEAQKHPAPGFNQNTEEVLVELGYSPEELQKLKAENVIP